MDIKALEHVTLLRRVCLLIVSHMRTHQTGSLCSCSDGIGLHKGWLPDKGPICVHDSTCIMKAEVRLVETLVLLWQSGVTSVLVSCNT